MILWCGANTNYTILSYISGNDSIVYALACCVIREVFQCSVLVCFWRVRHAWHKNLMKRCSDMQTRANLSKALGQIVKDISKGCGTVESFDSFMEDFVECKDFMDYFKAIWYPRIG